MSVMHASLSLVGIAALVLSAGYSVTALLALVVWRSRRPRPPQASEPRRPVTVLKPLCGAEPNLYQHLRSFCIQDYPQFQLVFGVRDSADPALAVAQRLAAEFPALSIEVVVDPQQHGGNYKTSNLINILAKARHDVLVIADSDARVRPDYLRVVTAPLLDPNVGLVTCIYHSVPTETIWSRLGAMYVNEWFVPSVLLAHLFGHREYASGQTLCMRRDTLEAIGGLQSIANHIADDYRLGELVRGLGQRIELSEYEVDVMHHEPSARALVRHEMRWMRTLRVVSPRSFRGLLFTFSLPMGLIGLIFQLAGAGDSRISWLLFAITAAARASLHRASRPRRRTPFLADLWLVPVRDLLLAWVWLRSFTNSSITWRGTEFHLDERGMMRRVA